MRYGTPRVNQLAPVCRRVLLYVRLSLGRAAIGLSHAADITTTRWPTDGTKHPYLQSVLLFSLLLFGIHFLLCCSLCGVLRRIAASRAPDQTVPRPSVTTPGQSVALTRGTAMPLRCCRHLHCPPPPPLQVLLLVLVSRDERRSRADAALELRTEVKLQHLRERYQHDQQQQQQQQHQQQKGDTRKDKGCILQ